MFSLLARQAATIVLVCWIYNAYILAVANKL